nr:hypothetical protein [Maliibacterium massiliense]
MSKEEREEISSYPNNDRFRTYLLQKKFGGSWPTIPEAIRSAYNITSKEDAPLYIQPYSVDPTDPSQAFVYASTVPGNGNWNTNLVYDHEEKTWYYNPKGTFSCTMPWAQVKARIHSDGWQALR